MKIIAVGHRGTWIGVPENSIASHEAAYVLGARGIEFDVQSTKDRQFIVFHDKTVDRMTNGKGKVSDMTLPEVKALKLMHNGQETQHEIPTLREALQNVRGRFMIDLDFKGGFDGSAEALKTMLEQEGFAQNGAPLVTIFCRDRETSDELMALNETYAVRPLYLGKKHAPAMAALDIKVMGLRNHQLTTKRADRIRGLGMHLFSNTMKYSPWALLREILGLPVKRKKPSDETLKRYYQEAITKGARFIQTDYLDVLVETLKEQGRYEDRVLDRHFNPIVPPARPAAPVAPPPNDDGSLIG